jgi:hypothetical protein
VVRCDKFLLIGKLEGAEKIVASLICLGPTPNRKDEHAFFGDVMI